MFFLCFSCFSSAHLGSLTHILVKLWSVAHYLRWRRDFIRCCIIRLRNSYGSRLFQSKTLHATAHSPHLTLSLQEIGTHWEREFLWTCLNWSFGFTNWKSFCCYFTVNKRTELNPASLCYESSQSIRYDRVGEFLIWFQCLGLNPQMHQQEKD